MFASKGAAFGSRLEPSGNPATDIAVGCSRLPTSGERRDEEDPATDEFGLRCWFFAGPARLVGVSSAAGRRFCLARMSAEVVRCGACMRPEVSFPAEELVGNGAAKTAAFARSLNASAARFRAVSASSSSSTSIFPDGALFDLTGLEPTTELAAATSCSSSMSAEEGLVWLLEARVGCSSGSWVAHVGGGFGCAMLDWASDDLKEVWAILSNL